jgi:hypothetical protein
LQRRRGGAGGLVAGPHGRVSEVGCRGVEEGKSGPDRGKRAQAHASTILFFVLFSFYFKFNFKSIPSLNFPNFVASLFSGYIFNLNLPI